MARLGSHGVQRWGRPAWRGVESLERALSVYFVPWKFLGIEDVCDNCPVKFA